jgi:hypothetical protein
MATNIDNSTSAQSIVDVSRGRATVKQPARHVQPGTSTVTPLGRAAHQPRSASTAGHVRKLDLSLVNKSGSSVGHGRSASVGQRTAEKFYNPAPGFRPMLTDTAYVNYRPSSTMPASWGDAAPPSLQINHGPRLAQPSRKPPLTLSQASTQADIALAAEVNSLLEKWGHGHCLACYAMWGARIATPETSHCTHQDLTVCARELQNFLYSGRGDDSLREFIASEQRQPREMPKNYFNWRRIKTMKRDWELTYGATIPSVCFRCMLPFPRDREQTWGHYHHDPAACPNEAIVPILLWLAWWSRSNGWKNRHQLFLPPVTASMSRFDFLGWTLLCPEDSNFTNSTHLLAQWLRNMLKDFTGHA